MKIQLKPYAVSRLMVGMLVLSAASVYAYDAQGGSSQLPIPRGVAMKSWQENGKDGRYVLQLIEGRGLKAGKTTVGTVTTDTDCDPDAQGLSHCHNTIELANGSKITVIDTHNMHQNRCLGAGDKISLSAISGSWIMGTLSAK